VPRGASEEIVTKLNAAIVESLANPASGVDHGYDCEGPPGEGSSAEDLWCAHGGQYAQATRSSQVSGIESRN
jgi:hypothetical protein